jgi:cellulose synthase/poly-beta-1,6-N-acetylglucosamine synthase-like glycosyltransferase
VTTLRNDRLPPPRFLATALSPFRQRAAKGMIKGYVMNGTRRLSEQFFYWSVPFAIGTYSMLL